MTSDPHAVSRSVGEALVRRGWSVAVAESCTGGLVAARLTDVSGSSRYVAGGVVAYADSVKTGVLGVDPALLARHGAVSKETARAMAAGVVRLLDTDVGVALTGIAGPGGGTPEKPVGTVWLAVVSPERAVQEQAHFSGDREEVRESAGRRALALLLEEVVGATGEESGGENPREPTG